VRRMLVVAAATCLFGAASADEAQKVAPGGEPGAPAGKEAEAGKKDGGPKAEGAKAQAPDPKAAGQPEKPKPCEPVRPCPID